MLVWLCGGGLPSGVTKKPILTEGAPEKAACQLDHSQPASSRAASVQALA